VVVGACGKLWGAVSKCWLVSFGGVVLLGGGGVGEESGVGVIAFWGGEGMWGVNLCCVCLLLVGWVVLLCGGGGGGGWMGGDQNTPPPPNQTTNGGGVLGGGGAGRRGCVRPRLKAPWGAHMQKKSEGEKIKSGQNGAESVDSAEPVKEFARRGACRMPDGCKKTKKDVQRSREIDEEGGGTFQHA